MPHSENESSFDYVLAHSPMLRQIAQAEGIEAAKRKLSSLSAARLEQTYQDIKAQVYLGAVAEADQPNEAPNLDTVNPLFHTIFNSK